MFLMNNVLCCMSTIVLWFILVRLLRPPNLIHLGRGLLYAMYSLALTMLVTTIVIYTLFVFGKSNTLPVTQPKETEMVAQPAAEKSAQPAQPATEESAPAQPAAEESAQPAQPAQPTVDAETPAQPTPTTENQVEL